jgi:hypothetical protein
MMVWQAGYAQIAERRGDEAQDREGKCRDGGGPQVLEDGAGSASCDILMIITGHESEC